MYARIPTITALSFATLLIGCSAKPDPARLTPITDSPERFAFAGG